MESILQVLVDNWQLAVIISLTIIAKILYDQVPRLKKSVQTRIAALRNNDFEKSIAVSQTVKASLEDLRIQMEADYAFICQFHNGRTFINETMHQYYYSVTWQVQQFGFKEIEIDRRAVSSDIATVIKIMTDDRIVIEDLENVKNQHFKYFNLTYGISSCICLKLVNHNDEIFGFIVIAYNYPRKINKTILDKAINFSYSFKQLLVTN